LEIKRQWVDILKLLRGNKKKAVYLAKLSQNEGDFQIKTLPINKS
jgi:hypothetical protein